jgi:3',5'-cyclic AMP phosphodiesterase CpdA
MTRIAHLSDLHFGLVDDWAVAALADDLRAGAPDLVVVSGDLTQRARRKQVCEARAVPWSGPCWWFRETTMCPLAQAARTLPRPPWAVSAEDLARSPAHPPGGEA